MAGLIDVAAERTRLGKNRERAQAELGRSQAKLENEKFISRAPEAVVAKERERQAELRRALDQFDEQLARLDQLD